VTDSTISVEVVYATPQRQELVTIELTEGSCIADAIEHSGLEEKFNDFEVHPDQVGIFGKKASLNQLLRDGDRVEIYRSLLADPKEVRRQRALLQAKS
jgi:putative ubiquitin-RnfH superfamily antitoxin RatB of RatAB toxin-antitoxin module